MSKYLYLIGMLCLSTIIWAQSIQDFETESELSLLSQDPDIQDHGPMQTLATALPLESYSYIWDEVSADWTLTKHNYYAYDSVDYRRVEYIITDALTDENETRWTYMYNSSGDQTLIEREIWVDSTSTWDINFGQISTYQYDAEGNRTEWWRTKWVAGDYINDRRWTYTWINAGTEYILTEFMQEVWQVNDDLWRNQTRTGYLYDGDLLLMERINYSWGGSDWIFNNRTRDYTWGADGLEALFLDDWDATLSDWVLDANTNYTRGDNGSYFYITDEWNGTEYLPRRRVSYEYTPEGHRSRYALENWSGTEYIYSFNELWLHTYDVDGNLQETIYQKETGTEPLINKSKTEYFNFFYLPVVSVLDTENITGLKIYPNPTNEQLNLQFDEVQTGRLNIYDLSGQLMLSETLEGQELSINLQEFAKGAYLLRLETNQGRFVQKFIKQ